MAVDKKAQGLAAKGLSANAPANSIPSVTNFDPMLLPHYRAALASAIAGNSRARIACMGDSVTAGAGAGDSGTNLFYGSKVRAYPAQLAKLFRGVGLVVSEDSIWGDANSPGASQARINAWDPKIDFDGAGLTWGASEYALGGKMFVNSSSADAAKFTPAVAGGNVDVYYVRRPGFATFTIKDGATTLGTVDSSGATAVLKSSQTRTSSANTVNVARTGVGTSLFLAGIDCWASNTQVSIYNMGRSGSTAADWIDATNLWNPLYALDTVAPDLVIIDLMTNDVRNGVDAATFKANMATRIARCQSVGSDVILVRPHPDNAPVNPSVIPAYESALVELSATYSAPLVNQRRRFVSYAQMNALGYYSDAVHLKAIGYADNAMSLWQILRPQ